VRERKHQCSRRGAAPVTIAAGYFQHGHSTHAPAVAAEDAPHKSTLQRRSIPKSDCASKRPLQNRRPFSCGVNPSALSQSRSVVDLRTTRKIISALAMPLVTTNSDSEAICSARIPPRHAVCPGIVSWFPRKCRMRPSTFSLRSGNVPQQCSITRPAHGTNNRIAGKIWRLLCACIQNLWNFMIGRPG